MPRTVHTEQEFRDISPALADAPTRMPFSLPEGYFHSFEAHLLHRISSGNEDISLLQPDGSKIGMPYTVPDQYFGQSPAFVADNATPARIRSISAGRIFRYAVAAVCIALLGWGLYPYVQRQPGTPSETARLIQSAHRILKSGGVDKELEQLGYEEAVEFLEESGHDVSAALYASQSKSITDESHTDDDWISLMDESDSSGIF